MSTKMKISRDTPLQELTLRRYEKPYNMQRREIIRKLCLSTGLLQPGDSRDIIVDILYVLLIAKQQKKELSSEQVKNLVIKRREEKNKPMFGVAPSNIRRQLKRLRDIYFIEKIKNKYRIVEFSPISETINDKIERYVLPAIITRIREYTEAIDKEFA